MERHAAIATVTRLLRDTAGTTDHALTLDPDMPLIGAESALDSMQLVELCLALEDEARSQGFEFDWTSESAMSRSRSMFRTLNTLALEYADQAKPSP